MLEIEIDENIRLEKLNLSHAQGIFDLINTNREYLRRWLTFVDTTETLKDTEEYISYIGEASENVNSETVISILYRNKLLGIISIKKVDWSNRIAEVGYWLGEQYQGKGIITRSCKAIVDYAFEQMGINRIEIKCGVGNERSCLVPQRLGFTFEGVERDGELVNNTFIDLKVFSLLKREWNSSSLISLQDGHFEEHQGVHRHPQSEATFGNKFS